MSVAEPAPAGGRIAALDILRGIAILGTFASNAWLFAVPGGAFAWLSGGLLPQDPVEAGLRLLSNGKFLALLTLLFGIGIELQYRSGVKAYLELITAETDLRNAQSNYSDALYQVLSSKIDVQKALGIVQY